MNVCLVILLVSTSLCQVYTAEVGPAPVTCPCGTEISGVRSFIERHHVEQWKAIKDKSSETNQLITGEVNDLKTKLAALSREMVDIQKSIEATNAEMVLMIRKLELTFTKAITGLTQKMTTAPTTMAPTTTTPSTASPTTTVPTTAAPTTTKKPDIICSNGWNKVGDGCYKAFGKWLGWATAEANCARSGGHLITASSKEKMQAIERALPAAFAGRQSTWVGGRFDDATRRWLWVANKQPVTNLQGLQYNGSGGQCMQYVWSQGVLLADDCHNNSMHICEIN